MTSYRSARPLSLLALTVFALASIATSVPPPPQLSEQAPLEEVELPTWKPSNAQSFLVRYPQPHSDRFAWRAHLSVHAARTATIGDEAREPVRVRLVVHTDRADVMEPVLTKALQGGELPKGHNQEDMLFEVVELDLAAETPPLSLFMNLAPPCKDDVCEAGFTVTVIRLDEGEGPEMIRIRPEALVNVECSVPDECQGKLPPLLEVRAL